MLQNRFKKILVPLDGSPNSIRGLNEAISLARQSQGTITGIYLIPGMSPRIAGLMKSYRVALLKDAQKVMARARDSAARHGIEFNEKIAASIDVVKSISAFAKSMRFDVIVIGSRGTGSPDARYLGSVSYGVVQESKVPVLIVK